MRKLGFNATGTVETPGTRANGGGTHAACAGGACCRVQTVQTLAAACV